ncbi:SDR family NAD(P)-dependent oxidoreductase [Halalkalibacter oceani]|uniref:SDR family NAD(P)-dependent oxidoreductase n=1 Tax=Halalkalibacter oceani TaxID=1653776 RepID=UPI003392B1FF
MIRRDGSMVDAGKNEKHVALVTGGATGLGKAISLELARAGMNVGVNYSRSEDEAKTTVEELTALGVEAIALKADVSSKDEVDLMVQSTVERFNRLDVVIANAGTTVFRPFEDLEGVSEADWDRIMNVNVKGIWLTVKAAAPYMKSQGKGSVVITSSIAGLSPSGSSLPYAVSKAAAIHLAKGLAKALGPEIRVNAIAPGILDTRWTKGHSDAVIEQYVANSQLKALPKLEDCVKQVRTFIEADTITGTVATIDAGVTL